MSIDDFQNIADAFRFVICADNARNRLGHEYALYTEAKPSLPEKMQDLSTTREEVRYFGTHAFKVIHGEYVIAVLNYD